MTRTENEILAFESRLLQDRRALNELVYMYYQSQPQGAQNGIMRAKLESLKRELDDMESQLKLLRANVMAPQPNVVQQMNMVQPQPNVMQPMNMGQPQGNVVQPMSQGNVIPPMPQPVNMGQPAPVNMAPQPMKTPKERDLEKTFGKSWMGIIASGLIFVSLIIFAILLVPHLTDGIKMAAMFAVSFAFAGVGFFKLGKDPGNRFYIALSGCGTGAVYISLLICNLYFHAINEIALYALILVWVMCVCVISRSKSVVFQWIGQAGIFLSVAFGCWLCADRRDEGMFLVLAGFFVLTSAVFALVHRRRRLVENWIGICCNLVNLVLFWGSCEAFRGGGIIALVAALLWLYIALHLIFAFTCEISESGLELGIGSSVCVFLMGGFTQAAVRGIEGGKLPGSLVLLALCVVLLAASELKMRGKTPVGKLVLQIVLLVFMLAAIPQIEVLDRHVYLAVLMLPFLVAGFLMDNWVFKYGSLGYLLVFFCHFSMDNPERMLWILLYFALLSVLSVIKKEQYQCAFRLLAYTAFLVTLIDDCSYLVDLFDGGEWVAAALWCVLAGILNLLLSKVLDMDKNPVTGETEKVCGGILYLIHSIVMIMSLCLIAEAQNEAGHFLMIAWALVLFLVNTKNLLERFDGMLAGIYVGIKLSVLLTVIVGSFDALGVPLSLGFLLFAIVSIVAGFRFGYKSLRIYGLCLSMVSVLKLIMADMSYENLTELAAAFFVSGILCFVISMIYNRIDRKYKEKQ